MTLTRGPVGLRRALARMAGRIAATRGWERLGFARLGDYAVERAGISPRELRELAAVDRALGGLRGLEQAYLAGRIGWSSLRLLCRVATPEDQDRWLALAGELGARALAREVRAAERHTRTPFTPASAEDEAHEPVALRLHRRARTRWSCARDVASRVAGQQLSHGEFAELLAAEVLSALPVDPGSEAELRTGEIANARDAGRDPTARSEPPIAPLPAGPDVETLERGLAEADAFELDRRLRRALALETRRLAQVASLLVDAVARGLHREAGFNSFDAWAEQRLGLCRSRARALLRVERAARECPPLHTAFASGRISWVQAEALLPLLFDPASLRHRPAWIAHAARVSVRRLRDDVERALARGDLAVPPLAGAPAGVQTGAAADGAGAELENVRLRFRAPADVAQLFRTVLAASQRAVGRARGHPVTRGEALEAMLAHALAAWLPEPPSARERREQAVFERDGWRCTAPGCSAQRNLQRHHVRFRSQGGGDEPENLTTLCAWHHLRGVHAGVLRCTGTAPDGLRFELGVRAGRPPLAVYGPGEVRMDA